MTKVNGFLIGVAIVVSGLLFSPTGVRANGLTGSVIVDYQYPNQSTTLASDMITVGNSIACPSNASSPICALYGGYGTEIFGVGPLSISYDISGFLNENYAPGSFNGFDFTGLTLPSGEALTGCTIMNNTLGLTSSDVNCGPSSITIDLAGLPVNGSFTLDLNVSGGVTPTPEPSTLVLMGTALLSLGAFIRRKARPESPSDLKSAGI